MATHSTLGVAVGTFTEDEGWFHTPARTFSHTHTVEGDYGSWISRVHRQYPARTDIGRRAMSLDGDLGEWEIQHFSLPWGWLCEEGEDVNIVEALVPRKFFSI